MLNEPVQASPSVRTSLEEIADHKFDVVVIGGGVNGASAAQHLSSAGYSVLLVEQHDYGAATSSRSSKLLHMGLAGLAPASSPWEYILHPSKLRYALKSAREQAFSRTEFATTSPQRVKDFRFYFPIFSDSPYRGWQIDIAFAILKRLNKGGPPLDYERFNARQAQRAPLLSQIRNAERLVGGVSFREYQFEWPERVVIDSLVDSRRMGAVVRNYTKVESFKRKGDGWALTLRDTLKEDLTQVEVSGGVVLNFAGVWVDEVNKLAETGNPRRLTTGSKGVHIMVKLDPEFRDKGIFTEDENKEHFYLVPWRGMHYIGPTDTVFNGDLNEVHPSEDDIELMLHLAQNMMPGLTLKRSDVIYSWAGVRPRTFDPEHPKGTWSREVHDLSNDGMPNVFSLTGSTIMRSRLSGRDILAAVSKRIKPSGKATNISFAAPLCSGSSNPETVRSRNPSSARQAIEFEQACTIDDVLFRRLGSGWDEEMGLPDAPAVANILAEYFGWKQDRIDKEIKDYATLIAARHAVGRQY